MADLYNTDLGGNSRKAQPSSLFGTRQLKFISINLYEYNLYTDSTDQDNNATTSYQDSNSLYSKIVTTIQEVAELYYLGAPSRISPNTFTFAIAADTAQWQYSDQGDIDINENGVDETEPVASTPPLLGWPERYMAGTRNGNWNGNDGQMSNINDIVDRLYWLLWDGPSNNDVYGISDMDIRELEDTGFGLMPGRFLY